MSLWSEVAEKEWGCGAVLAGSQWATVPHPVPLLPGKTLSSPHPCQMSDKLLVWSWSNQKRQSPVVRARCRWLEERWEHLHTTMKGEADECFPTRASVGRLLVHSSCLYQTICHLRRQLKSRVQKPALLSRGRRAQALWDECDWELLGGVGISPLMLSEAELQQSFLENIRLLISATAHPCCDAGKVTLVTTALGFLQTLLSSHKWIWKKQKKRNETWRQ